mgnify:FL=1
MSKFENRDGKLFIDGKQVLKGWESFSGWYWFATDAGYKQDSVIEGKVHNGDQIWFGLVQGFEEEWGYFSTAELKAQGNRVWPIKERDLPFAGRRND